MAGIAHGWVFSSRIDYKVFASDHHSGMRIELMRAQGNAYEYGMYSQYTYIAR